MSITYEYRLLRIEDVIGLTYYDSNQHLGAYLSDDAAKRALDMTLLEGFRWIRTDGDYAVFEREIQEQP